MIKWYYPMTIRGVVVALTDMFNDLQIVRLDDSGNTAKTFKVPITFGPVNKYQYFRKERELDKEYYLQLPRMALVMNGITYSTERATSVNDERSFYDTGLRIDKVDSFITDVMPAPYDYTFDLDIRTESMDDLCQILENVLPYFNPALYLRVREFSFLNIARDLPVKLDSISLDFTQEQEENQKREVNAKIGITVEGWQYRPISQAKMIKFITSRYFISDTSFTSIVSATSASWMLVDKYQTSGVDAISAAPTSAAFDTSGTFQTNIGGTSGLGYWFTSGTPYNLSAGDWR